MLSCSVFSRVCLCVVFLCVRGRPPLWRGVVTQTWATERKLNPKLEEYEREQLDKMLQIFYTEIRTKDGFEYEPESLKSMLAALDRYLKEHDYKYSIIRDREFHQSKLVLEGKVSVCLFVSLFVNLQFLS